MINVYNSLLFVPAKNKMLSKIEKLDAEAYIIDLEDSVEEEYKQEGLKNALDYLEGYSGNKEIYIRVNKENALNECNALKNRAFAGFMLPKFEFPHDYSSLGKELLEKYKIIALIETPLGIINIPEISRCSWVDALAFGAEDYTAICNMKHVESNLLYAKSMLLNYGKAYGKPIYDSPCIQLSDEKIIKEEVQNSFEMGFDGKLAINTRHIKTINEIFNYRDEKTIREIIRKYEESGKAVVVINGQLYEKMHINRLKKSLKEELRSS